MRQISTLHARFPRARFSLSLAALLSLGTALGGCADGEDVVRNPDGAERLAAYERAVDSETGPVIEELPEEAIPNGPDDTREVSPDSAHDRYAVPTNTPNTDVPKTEQVGATVCPENARLSQAQFRDGSLPQLEGAYEAGLLEENAPASVEGFERVRAGIERGYQPQRLDRVDIVVDGTEHSATPDELGGLGAALMKTTPCAVLEGTLDAAALSALDMDGSREQSVRLQLVRVHHGGTHG